jgi:glycosyltransferase involved in cell wall biosynthesis
VDLAYFVTPSTYALAFRTLPYVYTVWDLCHRDHPEFPEVGGAGEFRHRESLYRTAINRAYLTLTDSTELTRLICHRYGADSERLIAMPFQPAGLAQTIEEIERKSVEVTNRLQLPRDYLFYPAQFWPHKNHTRILQALAYLKERGYRFPAVFCGGDKGNKCHIQDVADRLGVADQVAFFGFVDEDSMQSLYALSRALVMPTYFGPTNLPPLEAWRANKPVIYSECLSAQVGDAAICVNPDSTTELAEAILRVYGNEHIRKDLAEKGVAKLRQTEAQIRAAESLFIEKLDVFRGRKLCWGT